MSRLLKVYLSPCIKSEKNTKRPVALLKFYYMLYLFLDDWSSNIYQAINKPMHEMFVKTQHYNEAREKLETHRIVVISGSIGTGKSFLARKLISEKIEEGYQLKSVESLFKWRTYGKQIVLLDDVFSKPCTFSRKSLELKSLLKTIQLYLEPDDETGKTVLLIITIRPDVLVVLKEDKSLDILQNVEYQVDLTQPIPFAEKLEILRTHEKKYSKSEKITDDCANDICKVKCPCFPICVKLFFQQDDLFQKGSRFFENPVRIIQSEISQMYKDDREVFAFLIMLILNDGEINDSCLGTDACIAHIDPLLGILRCRNDELVQIMNECLDRIPDLYVTRGNNKIKIQHDCIFQAICVSFSKILPMPCLKYLPFEFITERVRVETDQRIDEHIIIPSRFYVSLAERFLNEIELGCIRHVCGHQAMFSPVFLAIFSDCLQKLQETDKMKYFRILQSTEQEKDHGCLWNGCLLYWATAVDNNKLCSKLLLKNFYQTVKEVDSLFVKVQASATFVLASLFRYKQILLQRLQDLGGDINSSVHEERKMQTYGCDYCITQDTHGMTVLQASIFGELTVNKDTVRYLLENKAHFREDITVYRTLSKAVQIEDETLVRLLLAYQADVNSIDLNGNSALFYAVKTDNLAIAQILLANKYQKNNSYHLMNHVKSVQMASLLLESHDINTPDISGKIPLHYAFNEELVNFFFRNGSPVDKKDSAGRSPLFYSKTGAIALALISHNANITLLDSEGKNVAHFLQDTCVLSAIMNKMNEEGKNEVLNSTDKDGRTPIFYCSNENNQNKLEFLLKHGALVNKKCEKYNLRNSLGNDFCIETIEDQGLGQLIYTESFPCHDSTGENIRLLPKASVRQIYTQNWIAFSTKILFLPRHSFAVTPESYPEESDVCAQISDDRHSELTVCSSNIETENKQAHPTEKSEETNIHTKGDCTVAMNLIASGKFDIQILTTLNSYGVDWMEVDDHGNNVLHYLLLPQNEGNRTNVILVMEGIISKVSKVHLRKFINGKDDNNNTPLHLACLCRLTNKLGKKERIGVIKLLLQLGADVNDINSWNQTPLNCLLNCRCRSFELASILIKGMSKISINIPCQGGWSPLQTLLSIQDCDKYFLEDAKRILESLLEAGANLEETLSNPKCLSKYINPFLFEFLLQKYSCRISDEIQEKMVTILDQAESIPNTWTILAIISKVKVLSVDTFISKLATMQANDKFIKHTILKLCSQDLSNALVNKVVQWLFQSDKNLDYQDVNGNTYLINAVRYYLNDFKGLLEIMTFLLQKGANPNIKNSKNETVVYHLILSDGFDENVKKGLELLSNYGTNIDCGQPFIWAAKSHKLRTKVIQILPGSVSPDDEDEIGNAFHHLVKSYSHGIDVGLTSIKEFYAKGVEINSKNKDGETPLHMAVRLNVRKDIVLQLLSHNANVNRKNKEGQTPMHYILLYLDVNEIFLFNEFIRYGGDLSLIDTFGRNYLHYAVLAMRPDTLKILSIILQRNICDINAKNCFGKSILHTVCKINCRYHYISEVATSSYHLEVSDNEWCAGLRIHALRLLINFNGNIDITNSKGRSVMHILVIQYDYFMKQKKRDSLKHLHSIIGMIKLLISRKINLQIKDKNGKTVTDYLKEFCLTDLRNFFEGHISSHQLKEMVTSEVLYIR